MEHFFEGIETDGTVHCKEQNINAQFVHPHKTLEYLSSKSSQNETFTNTAFMHYKTMFAYLLNDLIKKKKILISDEQLKNFFGEFSVLLGCISPYLTHYDSIFRNKNVFVLYNADRYKQFADNLLSFEKHNNVLIDVFDKKLKGIMRTELDPLSDLAKTIINWFKINELKMDPKKERRARLNEINLEIVRTYLNDLEQNVVERSSESISKAQQIEEKKCESSDEEDGNEQYYQELIAAEAQFAEFREKKKQQKLQTQQLVQQGDVESVINIESLSETDQLARNTFMQLNDTNIFVHSDCYNDVTENENPFGNKQKKLTIDTQYDVYEGRLSGKGRILYSFINGKYVILMYDKDGHITSKDLLKKNKKLLESRMTRFIQSQ
ncbi:MAG: hypothetical protein ACTSXG_03410 [Alphaproteobacteria bacterium]